MSDPWDVARHLDVRVVPVSVSRIVLRNRGPSGPNGFDWWPTLFGVHGQDSRLELNVLGPVELRFGTRAIGLSPLGRSLAAVLAANADRVVSADRLIDALWGSRPPLNARNRLQATVSMLRRSVAAHDVTQPVVATTPLGYVLRTTQLTLDIARFKEWLNQARTRGSAGQAREAVTAYRTALAMWRGEPFEGVVAAGLEAETASLEELHLTAIEECVEAQLAAGGHGDAVAELTRLVATHPFRERLRASLMLALFRAGREADAVGVYRAGRERANEELGVEPGPQLQDLLRAILDHDPRLDLGGPETASIATIVGTSRDDHAAEPVSLVEALSSPPTPQRDRVRPHQLPMAVPDFTGRHVEVARLVDMLRTRSDPANLAPTVAVITGMGGVGKTTLAVRVAVMSADAYPDGTLFADLHGTIGEAADAHAVLGAFVRSLGIAPAAIPVQYEERLGLYRSLTRAGRVLVVLDDARDESQVRPLIPSGEGCAVIVTARASLLGLDGAARTPLRPMETDEAVSLLAAVAGAEQVDDPAAAREIAELCAGLPLAVRIVGARLHGQRRATLTRLIDELSGSDNGLDALSAGDRSVRACLWLSYAPPGSGGGYALADGRWPSWIRLYGRHVCGRTGRARRAGAARLGPPDGCESRHRERQRFWGATLWAA